MLIQRDTGRVSVALELTPPHVTGAPELPNKEGASELPNKEGASANKEGAPEELPKTEGAAAGEFPNKEGASSAVTDEEGASASALASIERAVDEVMQKDGAASELASKESTLGVVTNEEGAAGALASKEGVADELAAPCGKAVEAPPGDVAGGSPGEWTMAGASGTQPEPEMGHAELLVSLTKLDELLADGQVLGDFLGAEFGF